MLVHILALGVAFRLPAARPHAPQARAAVATMMSTSTPTDTASYLDSTIRRSHGVSPIVEPSEDMPGKVVPTQSVAQPMTSPMPQFMTASMPPPIPILSPVQGVEPPAQSAIDDLKEDNDNLKEYYEYLSWWQQSQYISKGKHWAHAVFKQASWLQGGRRF